MPTDAQRRNLASAHHAEVQALNERIAALTTENTRLEGLVYTPGLWRCAKCNFVLVQRNLNANSGAITARDQPGDKCPNCDVNLWRITERENARDNYETAERLHIELNEAKGFIALLEQQLAEARHGLSEVEALIDFSRGVAGLHMNGDVAPWSELRTGGRYESWLIGFDAAITSTQEQT